MGVYTLGIQLPRHKCLHPKTKPFMLLLSKRSSQHILRAKHILLALIQKICTYVIFHIKRQELTTPLPQTIVDMECKDCLEQYQVALHHIRQCQPQH